MEVTTPQAANPSLDTPPITESDAAAVVTEKKIKLRKDATMKQIRGSSLLLTGQLMAKGINFVVQVMIVRYLTKSDYGAFAYAMSIITLTVNIATFGLDRATSRFLPIYQEKDDFNKLFGTILMVISTMLTLGLACALFIYAFQGFVAKTLSIDEKAFQILLILIFLTPVNSLDTLMTSLFAVFSSPSSIFFRKYVLTPGLKVVVCLLLILGKSNVFFLATGYLVSAILGVGIYWVILLRMMKNQGLLQFFNLKTLQFPAREIFFFTIPLLTTDLLYGVMNTMDAVVLERFRDTTEVAALRAVQPTAILNHLVMTSFHTLFIPVAARMFARNDREGINNLYWQTAIWIAVLTFPIFILTFSFARPVTVMLYTERYEQSAVILAILSLGYYIDSALGLNGVTIKVMGKLTYSVVINVIAAILNFIFILVLIPRYGALGAAIGTSAATILHNVLKQAGLRLGMGINLFEWKYLRVYLIITVSAVALLIFQMLTNAPIYISIGLAALASFLVFRLNSSKLNIENTFPEFLRFPIVRFLLGK